MQDMISAVRQEESEYFNNLKQYFNSIKTENEELRKRLEEVEATIRGRKDNQCSLIETEEEKRAKDIVRAQLGFEPPRVSGFHMIVKVYTRDEDLVKLLNDDGTPMLDPITGKQKSIIAPEVTKAEDKYRNCTGLVVAQGFDCYKGARFRLSGAWCKVGDFIVFPRNEGTQVMYRGLPMQYLPDDRCLGTVDDPSYVTRG